MNHGEWIVLVDFPDEAVSRELSFYTREEAEAFDDAITRLVPGTTTDIVRQCDGCNDTISVAAAFKSLGRWDEALCDMCTGLRLSDSQHAPAGAEPQPAAGDALPPLRSLVEARRFGGSTEWVRGDDWRDMRAAAVARDERLSQCYQALGLLTTLAGSVAVDVNNPVKMATEIEAAVRAELAHAHEAEKLQAEVERLKRDNLHMELRAVRGEERADSAEAERDAATTRVGHALAHRDTLLRRCGKLGDQLDAMANEVCDARDEATEAERKRIVAWLRKRPASCQAKSLAWRLERGEA